MDTKPIRALLVEDNPGDSRLIREMLTEARGATFDLKYADRLQAALEQLSEGGIDVVLLDLGLPDSKGLETLSKTYAQAPKVPVVVLTGLHDETVGVQAVNRGAQDYLIKGQINVSLLVRTVRYAIERKQAEERESQLQLQLGLSERMVSIGVMVSGVAHEINNPLTKIMGFAELLMQKDIPEDTKEVVKIINDDAQRVAGIVKSLLAFAQQQKLERTYINVNEIIHATLAMRAHALEASNIKVTTKLDPQLPWTMADEHQLQQVFFNLIINAEAEMKSAHGRGHLLIKTGRIGNAIQVCFTDDGPGIAEENLRYLFVPFFTTRKIGKGTGLGLSICYGIVTEHGGRIYAESELDKGATFIVELPTVAESKEMELAKPVADEAQKAAEANILVVDDEPAMRQLLSRLLTGEGHEVVTVDNASSALDELESKRYDLILLDIKMPGMSGIDFYEYIQKKDYSLAKRIIFITDSVIGTKVEDFLTRNKAHYVTKTFDTEQLKRDINHILIQGA